MTSQLHNVSENQFKDRSHATNIFIEINKKCKQTDQQNTTS